MSISALRKLSIGYLLLPNLAFFVGWFRLPYAAVLIIGFLLLMVREIKKTKSPLVFTAGDLRFLLVFALIWTTFSGVAGLVAQTADFNAHNAKFFDLFKNEWPNYFPEIGRYSCYYFGYFLIPAAMSKLAGALLPSALFGWSAIGYFLAAAWVYHLVHKNRCLLFAFLWVKGTGHIIFYALKKSVFLVAPFYMPMIRATFEQSQWVPNQLIPTIIVTCILLHDTFERKMPQDSFMAISLLFIWGIFPAIALCLIFTLICIKKYIIDGSLKDLLSAESFYTYWIPLVLLLPTLIYFVSSNGSLSGALWEFDSFQKISFFYIIGFFADWVLYFLILHYGQRKSPWFDKWFINAFFLLFLLVSFLRIGKNNDWIMRGQIPFFLIIVIAVLRHLSVSGYSFIRNSKKMQPLFFILILGAAIQFTFSCYLLRDNIVVKSFFPGITSYEPIPYDRFQNVYHALRQLHPKDADAEQYLGQKDSLYEKYLARIPQPDNQKQSIP